MPYSVKNIALAPQGKLTIELAEKQMGTLRVIRELFTKEKPFRNLTIGMALHVTKETAVLVQTLRAGGANVAIAGCNPLSAQDDVCAALAKDGVSVYAYKGETKADYYKFIDRVIGHKPDLTIDDGCDIISLIHTKYPKLLKKLVGGTEETTTGVNRLRAMEKDKALKYPIVAVNDNRTKHLVDNYYGTGQSTLDGVLRATNMLIAGKTVVIAGYGDCGKGVAMRAKGLGARVIITEIDPFPALQAYFDGHMVMPMEQAAPLGDLFVTVTGNRDVIRREHFLKMKSGAVCCNSGHFDIEIDIPSLEKTATKKRTVRPFCDEYTLPNKNVVYILGEGRLINLASAEGHPSEIMDTSFAGQALACEYLVKNRGKLKPQVYILPKAVDQRIAAIALQARSLNIDKLTPAQKKYMASWEEGT